MQKQEWTLALSPQSEDKKLYALFNSDKNMKLIIRDIKTFSETSENRETEIVPVFLGHGEKSVFLTASSSEVRTVTFLVRQDGIATGWSVKIDVTERKIDIKETDFRV